MPHNIDSSIPLELLKLSQHQPITNVSQIGKKLETMIVEEEEECKGCFLFILIATQLLPIKTSL
jgi:hypothetical protein